MKKTSMPIGAAFALFMSTLGLITSPSLTPTAHYRATAAVSLSQTSVVQDRYEEARASRGGHRTPLVASSLPSPIHHSVRITSKPRLRTTNVAHYSTNSSGLTAHQIRIRFCESGGDYTNANPHSTASGAWQFLDSTWHSASKLTFGHALPGRARDYPPSVQDRVFLSYYAVNGDQPWESSRHCWG